MPINVSYRDAPLFIVPTCNFAVNANINFNPPKIIIGTLILIVGLGVIGLMIYLLIPLFPGVNGPTPRGTRPDFTVAQDGSGDYTTVAEAVAAAPTFSKGLFRIHIRSGVYHENVEVGLDKTNIVFVGDGKNKTIITSNGYESKSDESSNPGNATVMVRGDGFIAQDMTFENTAGPDQGPAIALSSLSDMSTFYRCSFIGHQATLHASLQRQFYRECEVYGTIDLIHGDASAVFQNCRIFLRMPSKGENITITAQGRAKLSLRTGFSIQNCTVAAAPDLMPVRSSVTAYLGRPLGEYSTVVIMQSFLDSLIDPAGWLDRDDQSALTTLFYAEYKNRGPGADTRRRVKWPGYKVINSTMATKFTVANFIQGDKWLPSTGVSFIPGLI